MTPAAPRGSHLEGDDRPLLALELAFLFLERAILRAEPLDVVEEPLGLGHLGRSFLGLRLGSGPRTEKQQGGDEHCGRKQTGRHATSRVIRAAF